LGASVDETAVTISPPSTPGLQRYLVEDVSSAGPGDGRGGGNNDNNHDDDNDDNDDHNDDNDDHNDNDNDNENDNDKAKPPERSIPLERSVYPVLLTLLYGGAAVYAWVVICILNHRPIGGESYGQAEVDRIFNRTEPTGMTIDEGIASFFARSERYLRAARIVQSLVSVVTIPLTSAVCSQAAVVYIQRTRGANRPTLRQTMALADKGWTDIAILTNLFFGGWKRYRSSLLLFALFLHLLGEFIIVPDPTVRASTNRWSSPPPRRRCDIPRAAIVPLLPDDQACQLPYPVYPGL
jgi:hypothetical protein